MLLALYSTAIAPPATALVKQANPPAPLSNLAFTPQLVNWQAADPILGNSFLATNVERLFIWNTSVSTPRTVTLKSFPENQLNRSVDLVLTIGAGQMYVFGPISRIGWAQKDGLIYVWSSSSDILLNPMTFG